MIYDCVCVCVCVCHGRRRSGVRLGFSHTRMNF